MNVLVTGGTGKTGRHVVHQLAEAGHRVAVASRHPVHAARPGSAPVRFDWSDSSTWGEALAGAESVYLVTPALVADPWPVVAPFLEAAAGRRLVLLSALGVDDDPSASGLQALGQAVLRSGGTVLQPNWFLQNLTEGSFAPALREGVLPIAAGDGAVSFVDARDVADVAVAALTAEHPGVLQMTGPRALTHQELAELVARASGHPVHYADVPPEAMRERLIGSGVPADYADLLLERCAAIRRGDTAVVTGTVERVTGRPARTVEAFVREHAAAWQDVA